MTKVVKQTIEYLIYLFIFLLPFQTAWIWREEFIFGFKWHQGSYLLYGTELILWLIILLQLFMLLKNNKIRIFKLDKNRSVIVFLIWFFMLWSVASIFWSSGLSLSAYWLFRVI